MSETVILYAEKSAYVDSANPSSRQRGQVINVKSSGVSALLLKYEDFPTAKCLRPILSARSYFYATVPQFSTFSDLNGSPQPFDPAQVTFNNRPAKEFAISGGGLFVSNSYPYSGWGYGTMGTGMASDAEKSAAIAAIIRSKSVWPVIGVSGTYFNIETSDSSDRKPYLSVEIGDSDVDWSVFCQSPTEGYVNPRIPNRFYCGINVPVSPYSAVGPGAQLYPKFFWRVSGASSWNTSDGHPVGTNYYDVPANTFPIGATIEFKFSANPALSGAKESPVYTVSTTDSLATATDLTPSNTVEDGSAPITFNWTASNPTGSIPTGANLQWSSNNGETWQTLGSVSGNVSAFTAAADTFPAGDIAWRVRVKNADGTAGDWSNAAFRCLSAPGAPSVNSDANPFATITWQSQGQQAYEVTIDGKNLGVKFGSARSFTLPVFLSDGSHTVSVRVQNIYGLWSEPGSLTFNVANIPGESVLLNVNFGVDAGLNWVTSSETADFLIFRDGVLIGHTSRLKFTDRFVLGEHEYFVINRLPSGNYSRSNTVTGRMCVRRPTVAALDGGEWIELKYSEKSMPEQRFTWSQTHSLRHISGAKWPVLEVSPFEDLSGTYDAAFLCACDAAAFRELRGKVVIMKSRDGKVVIGALVNVSEVVNAFYLSMQFTIEQIHWEDYVDDADG